jgi:chemotaxis protein methyltransferase CheR
MSLLSAQTLSHRDLQRIASAVYEHCGINLHDGKQELVQARLTKLLRHSRFSSIDQYVDHVLANPESEDFAQLIDNLSTNLTSFFRENEHFAYLFQNFLPDLFSRLPRNGKIPSVRGWSAACSTGEEPYSIAMVVQEYLESNSLHADTRILATDISRRVLATARDGIYDRRRTIPVPPQFRHFFYSNPKDPSTVEPAPAVRQMVRFAHLNLIEPWPFTGPLDFIFCRNVMIYFDKPTQQRLIERFFDILSPQGLLFTGHSESLTGIEHRFRYVRPTIYQKP